MKNQKEIEKIKPIIERIARATKDFIIKKEYTREKREEEYDKAVIDIQSLLQSEKKKWKAEMMEIIGEDESLKPEQCSTFGINEYRKWTRNQFRQQLREKVREM